MDSSKLKTLFIIVTALACSLYLGIAAATDQREVFVWVGGGLFLTLCLLLGKHVWLLIPATLPLVGSLNAIPGSPAPWHLMTAVTGAFFLLRWLTRKQALRFHWTSLDTAILLVGLTILQALIRNPVGFSIFGGDVSGGKPYFIAAVAITAYVLISMADTNMKTWRLAVILYISFAFADAIIGGISGFYPEFAGFVIRFYSNVSLEAATSSQYDSNAIDNRITVLTQLGGISAWVATTMWRPISALDIRKPWRMLVAALALAATGLGGFRSNASVTYVHFIIGSLLRRKPLDVIFVSFLGVAGLFFVIVAIPTHTLPYSIQRILTIVPGFDARADIAANAEDSTEMRFNIWRRVLSSDQYIHNKYLGDGFQYSAREMAAREAMRLHDYRMAGGLTTEDLLMITGSYHGFHVETIRFTGVIGLIAATGVLIVLAVHAWRNIAWYRGTPYWNYVMFICMPMLIYPATYWLIFGEYKGQFLQLIAMAGLVKLLHVLKSTDMQGSVNQKL